MERSLLQLAPQGSTNFQPLDAAQQRAFSQRQMLLGAAGTAAALGSIALLSTAILYDLGDSWNAVVTFGLGLTFQASLHFFPHKFTYNATEKNPFGRFVDWEHDKVVKYAATFFICFTQFYLNVGEPRWFVRLTYGMFNTVLGAQIVTKFATVLNLNYMKGKSRDADASLREVVVDEGIPIIQSHTLSKKIETLWGKGDSAGTQRWVFEAAKAALAAVGIFCGLYFSSATVALKFGLILGGHAVGSAIHEAIHDVKKRLIQRSNQSPILGEEFDAPGDHQSTGEKIFTQLEKIEQIAGLLLPGTLVAFNIPATDVLSGVAMGMLSQIDWIRFTRTPVDQLPELKLTTKEDKTWMDTAETVSKWAFAILVVGGFLGFGVVQGALDANYSTIAALSTLAVTLYGSYALTRFLDTRTIPNKTPLINTAFFFTNYSLAAPIIYIAVTQVLQIGDYALDTYALYAIAVSCLGWASLGFAFGTQAGARATERNVAYPAEIDPLIILYTFFFVQQLLGTA